MGRSNIRKYSKNSVNPFMEMAIEKVNGHIAKKYKSATNTDEKAILTAIDEKTGEYLGHTSFIRQIEVDEEKFTKVYLAQFSAFLDLGKPAIRVFGYIMEQLQPKKDMFIFLLEECMKHTGYKANKSINEGISDLLEAGIIARGPADSLYYINPLVAFNGDRVSYTKTFVKKKTPKIAPNQTDLFDSSKGLENFEAE